VVDVEQRALRTLEHDELAAIQALEHEPRRVWRNGQAVRQVDRQSL